MNNKRINKNTYTLISHLNIHSISNKSKQIILNDHLIRNKIDVMSLNETFLNKKLKFELDNYSLIRKDRNSKRGSGVAFLIKNEIPFDEIPLENTGEIEAIAVKLNINNSYILAISCYAPPNCRFDPIFLQHTIEKYKNEKIIIMGDFNALSNCWYCPENNRSGEILEEFVQANDLIVKNTNIPTFEKSQNVLDLFICNKKTIT